MFESLSARLGEALKKITGRGVLRAEDLDASLREVRLARFSLPGPSPAALRTGAYRHVAARRDSLARLLAGGRGHCNLRPDRSLPQAPTVALGLPLQCGAHPECEPTSRRQDLGGWAG